MDGPLIAARAIHFAAQISLAGIFGFVALVAAPAYARTGSAMPVDLRRKLGFIAAGSLVLTLISAIPWLLFVARSMSGKPVSVVLTQGIVGTVLTDTQFGHAWVLRFGFMVLLIPFIVALGRRRALDAMATSLGAALLAATAWQGHAGAEQSFQGIVHVCADAIHLVVAGLWLGALLPLALLLAAAHRESDRRGAIVAQAATVAFSSLGLSCVAALLITGTISTWFLVGSVPALIGTLYGELLLLKIALFAVMVTVAAINRLRLLPRLAATDHGRKAIESRIAVGQLERNALIEALIGLGVIAIVAVLGTQTPAAHEQPWWPFPYRLGFDEIASVPDLRNDAIGTAILALLGLVLIGFGWRRQRVLTIATGLVLFFGLGWRPIQLLMLEATPTSYYASSEPYTVRSILAGGKIYTQHCASCHGKSGQGDGPLAVKLPIAPADLTAHLTAHRDGDVFWFISHGLGGGVMPAFAATLDETQRWDVINALKAHADTDEAAMLRADVATNPAPLAPDFSFPAPDGAPGTLKTLLARDAVLLVLTDAPLSSFPAQVEDWRSVLAASGVAIIVVTDDPALRSVYALYDRTYAPGGANSPKLVAFLIDRDGYIRARWYPGGKPDWGDLATLTQEIIAMGRLKLAPAAQNIHVHSPG
jgi:putative copper export protein/mono/diheme cytochrome c family protein